MIADTSFRNDLLRILALMESQVGQDNLEMIHILRPLAAQFHAHNEHDRALPLQEQILRLCLQNPDHAILPSEYDARKAVAVSLQALGRYPEAVEQLTPLLRQDDSAETAAALVACLQGASRWIEAVRLCEQWVERTETIADEQRAKGGEEPFGPRVSWIMRLSQCYSKQGKYAKAAEIFERTVPIMKGKHELLCIPQLDFLSELYRKAKDEKSAQRVLETRREIARRNDY